MRSNQTEPIVCFEWVSMEDRLREPSSAPCRNTRFASQWFYLSVLFLSVCCWVPDTCKHSQSGSAAWSFCPIVSEPIRIMLRSCCVYGAGILCVLLLIAGIAMALAQVFQKLINNTIKEVSVYECVFICFSCCVLHMMWLSMCSLCMQQRSIIYNILLYYNILVYRIIVLNLLLLLLFSSHNIMNP